MNLLLGHAALYQIKVADALLGGSAAQLDAAAGGMLVRCGAGISTSLLIT